MSYTTLDPVNAEHYRKILREIFAVPYRQMYPAVDAYLLRDEVAFLLWRLRLPKRFKRQMGPDAVRGMYRSDMYRKAAIRQTAKKFNFGREPHQRSTKESA